MSHLPEVVLLSSNEDSPLQIRRALAGGTWGTTSHKSHITSQKNHKLQTEVHGSLGNRYDGMRQRPWKKSQKCAVKKAAEELAEKTGIKIPLVDPHGSGGWHMGHTTSHKSKR